MNEMIVIPDKNIEIIMSQPYKTNKYIHLVYLKRFLITLTLLFVAVMILWFFDVFNKCTQSTLTIVYISMICLALIIKIAKLFMKKNPI